MFKIEWAPRTKKDFRRLKEFLAPKSLVTANKIRPAIIEGVHALALNPQLGTLLEEDKLERRIWRTPFGNAQYVLYYIPDFEMKTIRIVRIWHSREDRA